MLNRMVPFAALVCSALPAAAQPLIVADDPVFGSGSITIDTAQQLAFLDLTIPVGISQADMAIALAPGGAYDGWRLATRAEVVTLINNYGWTPALTSPFSFIQDGDGALGAGLLAFLGDNTCGGSTVCGSSLGLIAGGNFVKVRFEQGGGTDGFSQIDSGGPGSPSLSNPANVSHWLVRGPAVNDSVTYQGRLADGGVPVTGQADFQVIVYDGFGVFIPGGFAEFFSVDVASGLFSLNLPADLPGISDPDAQIEIGVRFPAGPGFFDFLTPYQPLTPTTRALEADHATTALAADSATIADTLSNESSVAISLNSGLAPYGVGYLAPTATRQGNTVVLNGMIRDTTVTYEPGDSLCTLPAGFRPPARLIFLQASSAGVYRVDVLPTGVVELQGAPGVGGIFNWVCLDGISFPVD